MPLVQPYQMLHTLWRRCAGVADGEVLHQRWAMVVAACCAAVEVSVASATVRFHAPAESKAQSPAPGCQKALG